MVLLTPLVGPRNYLTLPSSLRSWQQAALRSGTLPVIGVAGSRGKSTVVRMLESIFSRAGLRTAVWTNRGVEVMGRRQRGEIAGWTRALNHLAEGLVDVALQELDWATVNAVGLPVSSYPMIAVTNLCANSATCLTDENTQQALKALPTVLCATQRKGTLVLNGDDFQLLSNERSLDCNVLVVALSGDSPAIRARRLVGELGLWVVDDTIVLGDGRSESTPIIRADQIPLTLNNEATFETSNAIIASGIALACGMDTEAIRAGLSEFSSSPALLPGSFNVHHLDGARVVVDRMNPSWFLRTILRAVVPGGKSPLVTVLGSLDRFSDERAYHIGRLLGRYRGAVISHSTHSASRLEAFRRGLTRSSVPPLMIRLPTERRAFNRGLKAMRSGAQMLILTDDPDSINRSLARLKHVNVRG